MLSRRELLSGAALGGAPGLLGVEAGQDSQSLRAVTEVLENIRDELAAGGETPARWRSVRRWLSCAAISALS